MAENNNLSGNVSLIQPTKVDLPEPVAEVKPVVSDFSTIDESRGKVVKTTDMKTGNVVEGPKTVTGPDLSGATETAKSNAAALTEQATTDADALIKESEDRATAIQQNFKEATEKLQTKVREETEKDIERRKVLRDEADKKNLEKRSLETKTILNSFSHQLAQGKDSGYINALNMSSLRSANNTYANSSDLLNAQFAQDTNNIYNREFDKIFSLDEGLLGKITDMDVNSMNFSLGLRNSLNTYKQALAKGASDVEINNMTEQIKLDWEAQQKVDDEWNSGMKDVIERLFEAGKFDEAMLMAEQASEVSDHPWFQNMTNPSVVESLKQDNDVNVMNTWTSTLNGPNNDGVGGITDLALRANDLTPALQAESMNNVFTLMMRTPDKANGYIERTWVNTPPEERIKWGITEGDEQVIEEFIRGDRTLDDPQLRESFFKVMMNEAADGLKASEFDSLVDGGTGIKELLDSSPVPGEPIYNWLKDGYSDNFLDIEVGDDTIFGEAGITRINFFGENYDANDLNSFQGLSGLDVGFREFEGDSVDAEGNPIEGWESEPFTNEYKPINSTDKKTIGGIEYTNKELSDAFLQYFNEHTSKWNKDKDVGSPMTMDGWANKLRTENTTGAKTGDLKGFNKKIGEDPNVITMASGEVFTMSEELKMMSERNKELFKGVITEGNVNGMDIRDFASLMEQDQAEPALREINEKQGLYLDVPIAVNDATLQRGTLMTEENHVFSTGNLEDTISKLKPDPDSNTFSGNMMYNGVASRITMEPARHHNDNNSDAYWGPVAKIYITPLGGDGEPKEIRVRLPDTTQYNPNVQGGSTKAKTDSLNAANAWFKSKTGGQ